MTALTRREALAAATFATLAAAMPVWAQDKASAADVAAWDLSDLYPTDAAWDEARRAAHTASSPRCEPINNSRFITLRKNCA